MLDITKLQKWKENFIALSLALVIPFTCTSCNSKKGTEQSKETLLSFTPQFLIWSGNCNFLNQARRIVF